MAYAYKHTAYLCFIEVGYISTNIEIMVPKVDIFWKI